MERRRHRGTRCRRCDARLATTPGARVGYAVETQPPLPTRRQNRKRNLAHRKNHPTTPTKTKHRNNTRTTPQMGRTRQNPSQKTKRRNQPLQTPRRTNRSPQTMKIDTVTPCVILRSNGNLYPPHNGGYFVVLQVLTKRSLGSLDTTSIQCAGQRG